MGWVAGLGRARTHTYPELPRADLGPAPPTAPIQPQFSVMSTVWVIATPSRFAVMVTVPGVEPAV